MCKKLHEYLTTKQQNNIIYLHDQKLMIIFAISQITKYIISEYIETSLNITHNYGIYTGNTNLYAEI